MLGANAKPWNEISIFLLKSKVWFSFLPKNKKVSIFYKRGVDLENKKESMISPFSRCAAVVFLLVVVLYAIASRSVLVADYLNGTLCYEFRRLMASFGDLFPFSLFEVLILSLPLTITVIVISAVRRFRRGEGRVRFISNFVAVVLLIYSGHLIALGIGYKTTPLSERMGIGTVSVDEDTLSRTLIYLKNEVNELAPKVNRNSAGVFVSGYGFDELSDKILESYQGFYEEYGYPKPFKSRAKGVHYGNLMSYLEITGIYTFFTGEANVNTAFPDFDIVFTTAHELAHQRGILRENEANFAAYVICSASSDDALRYSGALSMYEYISSALYRTNPELYTEIAAGLCSEARADIVASREVAKKYSNTIIGEISNKVNDIYLKGNGTEGVVSYSRVVELAVSYLHEKIGE